MDPAAAPSRRMLLGVAGLIALVLTGDVIALAAPDPPPPPAGPVDGRPHPGPSATTSTTTPTTLIATAVRGPGGDVAEAGR